jgi:ribosomal protein S18 acetylase RimI-like enzyme
MGTVAENEPFAVARYGYVSGLYVGQEDGDGGMKDGLLDAVEGRFTEKGVHAAQVDVSCRDMAAQRFWQSRGFETFLDHLWRSAESAVCGREDPDFVVRPARAADRPAVVLLWGEMMGLHAAMDGRLSIAADWRTHVEESFGGWSRHGDNHLTVAEGAEGVVGFALGGVVQSTIGLTPGTHGHIAHMCVGAQWRRRGVGRQLFASLRDWFVRHGVSSIHLYASCLNPVAQRFWRGLGFEDYINRLWHDLV